MLYRFWQFSRHAQIEQYFFSIPMILTPPKQQFPVAVRTLPYLHTDLKSRKLIDIRPSFLYIFLLMI
jgi:hypothetical protein